MISSRVSEAFARHPDRSPLLVVDFAVATERHHELTPALPSFSAFCASKANPYPELLARLVARCSSFDVTSIGEVHAHLDAWASPDFSFGKPVSPELSAQRA